MDVLVSGRDRAPVRVPRWAVVGAVVALVVAVIAGGLVLWRAEQRAADVSDLRVELQLESSSREYGGALYGMLAVHVRDPQGGPLQVSGLAVEVPGVHHAPARALPVVADRGEVAVRLPFVVFSCGQLDLPGQVVLRAARGDREAVVVRRPVRQGAAGEAADGSALLVACGRLPQSG